MQTVFTQEQLNEIYRLKAEGVSNKDIAKAIGLSYETVKKYLSRHPKQIRFDHCINCGASFSTRGKVKKKFCSEKCRKEYWSRHRHVDGRKSTRICTCQECHKTYLSYGRKVSKFCSRECFRRFESRKWGGTNG